MSDGNTLIEQQPCVNCGKPIHMFMSPDGTVFRKGCVHAKLETLESMERKAELLAAFILSRGAKKQNTDS
ncbi:MAG: hypothetical protein EBW87_01355 [Burkholderiaceae bacterium]|nr:hypothetical protein [Burkholderiaceae bacterium]